MTIEQVEATLLEHKIEIAKVHEIIKDLAQAAEEEKADRKAEGGPKQKWEHVIVLNDPDGKMTKDEFVGWVVQQENGQDAGLILSKLVDAAKVSNDAAKRKKNVIKNFMDLFGALKPKFTKEQNIKIKTKEPVRILVVNGNSL